MADFVFNIAKGRVVEYYNRVEGNDPAASALIIIPILTAGLETDAVLMDKDTLADVLAGTTDEATAGGWARKVLTDADLAALPAPDDTNNRYAVDLPDQAFGAITAGNDISKLIVAFDGDTAAGTDANIVPLTCHDFVILTDGSAVTATIADFFRAS
jgi:hypothetical protein